MDNHANVSIKLIGKNLLSLQSQMLGTVAPFKLLFAMAIIKLDFNQFFGRGVYLSKVPKVTARGTR